MNSRSRQPSRDELLAMAYVDGELAPDAEREFAGRLASDAGLARQVAEYKKLELLARQIAPPEPADQEWERLQQEVLQQGSLGLGFVLMVLGALGLFAYAALEIARSELPLLLKILVGSVTGGLLLVFLSVLRSRMRTYPLDPYTAVKR